MREAVQNTQQIIQVDYMTIIMMDSTTKHWRRVAYSDGQKVVVARDDATTIPMENTTGGYVLQTKRMLTSQDLSKTEYRFTFNAEMMSAMSLPLTIRGAHVGMVEVGSLKANAYTQTDSAIFQQLVSQISIGLENAETYSQSQRLAKTKSIGE